MNIAVCLSGQPRCFKKGLSMLKSNLKENINDIDFYFHFWYDENQVGKPLYVQSNSRGNEVAWVVEPNSCLKIFDMLNPKDHLFAKPIDKFDLEDRIELKNNLNKNAFVSMFYSRNEVGKLLKKSKKVYDIVIWIRSDFGILQSQSLLEEIKDPNVFYAAHEDGNIWNKYHLNTALIASNQKNMLDYLSIHNYLELMYKKGVVMCDHELCFQYMSDIGVEFGHILKKGWRWLRNE